MSPDRDVRRTAAEAVTVGARARAAHARVRVQHAARRQVDRRPAAQLPVVDRQPQPRQRGERRVGAGAGRRGAGALRHPAALVLAQGAAARPRPHRRLRPHGVGGQLRRGVRLGRGAARSCSTRTRRSRPSWRRRPSGSSPSRGSTRRCGRASARARSARTRCRASTRTCCSTGPPAGATCSRSRTRWATGCTPTSRASRAIFHQTTPLTLAETASVFGETVTFGRLLDATDDPAARLALLAESLEGQIATVFRQVAMNRFEDRVHTQRRDAGELSVEQFNEAWTDTQTRDARRHGRDHRRLPHVVVVHPALHGHARVRLRVRVRAAARAVGVPRLRGAGRRVRAAVPRAARGRWVALARGAGPDRRARPRRSRRSGAAASRSSPSSSTPPRPRPRPPAGSELSPTINMRRSCGISPQL